MRITGMAAVLSDCEPGSDERFTRWMDLDYLPEVLALPGVVAANRYVSPQSSLDLRAAHGIATLEGGKGRWQNLYLFTGNPAEAWSQVQELDKHRIGLGRVFPGHKVAHVVLGQFERGHLPRGATLAGDAASFVGHRGMYLGVGDLQEPARSAEVIRYYDEVHIPNMLSAPHVIAVTRFSSVLTSPGDAPGRQFVNTVYFDSDQPSKVVEGLRQHLQSLNQRFATPSAYRMLYAGSYRRLEPLRS